MAIVTQISRAAPSLSDLCALLVVGLIAVWTSLYTYLVQEGASITPSSVCEEPRYTVRTLSFDPLIQHIENFITPTEIQHLLSLA